MQKIVDNIGYILYYEIEESREEESDMPVISKIYGITIKMYFRQKEHNPPHIHAIYGDYIGVFLIDNGEMFEGDMPYKGQLIVREFIDYYRTRLIEMWNTQIFEKLPTID